TVVPGRAGVAKFILECNYLQALEGDCDTAHAVYLHRGNNGEGVAAPREDPSPEFEVERTWCGLRAAAFRRIGEDGINVRISTFTMPCIGSVPVGKSRDGKLDGFQVVYQVPSDDYRTCRYNIRFQRSLPISGVE